MRQLLDEDSPLADAARDLSLCVGGAVHLESLDSDPLPTAEFPWKKIPVEQQSLVVDILTAIDMTGVEIFGPETEAALHRLVVIAAGSPLKPLHRRTTAKRLAAALTWIVLSGNQQFSRRYGQTAKVLWSHFGVASCSELGKTIARDLGMWACDLPGVTKAPVDTVFLGDPGLLFSKVRRTLVGIRDEMAWLFESELKAREAAKPLVVTADGSLEARAVRVDVANAFVGHSTEGCEIVVALTHENDSLEMLSLSIDQAKRLVACVTDAMTTSGLAS